MIAPDPMLRLVRARRNTDGPDDVPLDLSKLPDPGGDEPDGPCRRLFELMDAPVGKAWSQWDAFRAA